MNTIRVLSVLVLILALAACATPASRFSTQKHGLVVGSVLVTTPGDIPSYQVQVLARQKGALLVDAVNLYLKPGQEQTYHAILAEGEYAITAIRVITGALRYEPTQLPPLTFTIGKGRVSRLGRLEIRLGSKDGLLGRVVESRAELAVEQGDAEAFDVVLAEAYPELTDLSQLPTENQKLLATPTQIELAIRNEGEDRGGASFSF